MKGIGLTMEAIEQNPVLYELMTDHTWRNDPIDLDVWLPEYVQDRYGSKNSHAASVWRRRPRSRTSTTRGSSS
jgi:alpha-N-acetylglucosaminidase